MEGKRIKLTTILVVVPVRMPRMESQANKSSVLEGMIMQGVKVTLVIMVKESVMGVVMMTLGEKANKSSVLEGMFMQAVKVTLVVIVKLFAMGVVTTLGENANESSVSEGMVMQEVKIAGEKWIESMIILVVLHTSLVVGLEMWSRIKSFLKLCSLQ